MVPVTVTSDEVLGLARRAAAGLSSMPGVVAVAMGGSRGRDGLGADGSSDLDLEMYVRGEVPVEARRRAIESLGPTTRLEVDLRFWGLSDEWLDAATGIHVDVTSFDVDWMEDRLDTVLVRHEASLGYTTCFWHTIRGSVVLADDEGWLAGLTSRADVPYPETLRANIVARNHPVLRSVLPSYAHQIGAAVARRDLVSIQHRLAGLVASYADIVFALDRRTHPGEKRLVEALARCARVPVGMASDLEDAIRTSTTDPAGLGGRVERLIDRLDDLLRADGFTIVTLPSLRR